MVSLTAAKHNAPKSYSESTTRQAFGEIGGEMAHLVLNCDGVDLVTDKLGNVTTIGRTP
jgi:hypothetical protein